LINRATYYYCSKRKPDLALRQRIKEIAGARIRYGYQRIYVLLRREGWKVNHKWIHRIYKEEYLSLRIKRPKRRVSAIHRLERSEVNKMDQCWSMDFVADQLYNGRRLRTLTIVDNFSRQCMGIYVGST
jgi:putative transposase